jgi:hypothetical protein
MIPLPLLGFSVACPLPVLEHEGSHPGGVRLRLREPPEGVLEAVCVVEVVHADGARGGRGGEAVGVHAVVGDGVPEAPWSGGAGRQIVGYI